MIKYIKPLIVLCLVIALGLPLSAPKVNAAPAQPAPLPQSGGGNHVYLPGVGNGLEGLYVATYGSDSNSGTSNQPWRTLAKAARSAPPGRTVYVRGGTYNEVLDISNSGSAGQPIRIVASPGETPVIEGGGSLPSSEKGLITIRGSYVQVSGFEVRNSRYYGAIIMGPHSTISNSYIHHSQMFGIFARGDYSLVENNRVWRSSLMNENSKGGRYYAALTAGGASGSNIIAQNITLRGNTVWENWGEGISTFNANGTVIEGNVIHDSFEANIYISDSTNVICQRNFLYMNPSSYVYNQGANVGISMGDETFKPRSANIKVLNNIAYGNSGNFFWWRMDSASGLVNVEIANNTFVNSTHEGSVIIQAGAHQGSRFTNNLVVQDTSLPVISISATSGISFSNNLWSKTASSLARGANDVVGDPRLTRSGSQYGADWFRLNGDSPAIGRGVSVPSAIVDYFSRQRGNPPDIGAAEFVR